MEIQDISTGSLISNAWCQAAAVFRPPFGRPVFGHGQFYGSLKPFGCIDFDLEKKSFMV
jgi:hypothetical protein